MPDLLTITRTPGRIVILHLGGRLDGQTQSKLVEAAKAEHTGGTRFLLIDLQGLEMITSAGLGALHSIYSRFTPREEIEAWEKGKHGEPYKSAYFKLAAAAPNIYYVLNIAGFLSNIPIYPSLQEALDSFPR